MIRRTFLARLASALAAFPVLARTKLFSRESDPLMTACMGILAIEDAESRTITLPRPDHPVIIRIESRGPESVKIAVSGKSRDIPAVITFSGPGESIVFKYTPKSGWKIAQLRG